MITKVNMLTSGKTQNSWKLLVEFMLSNVSKTFNGAVASKSDCIQSRINKCIEFTMNKKKDIHY